jgi:triosephosphate isomerase
MKTIIAGNWKMYPQTLSEAKKIFTGFKRAYKPNKNVDVLIFPPVLFLSAIRNLYSGSKIGFGAQNTSTQPEGALTGEVSSAMIKSLKCKYVIIGHSERRSIGETNELIAHKIKDTLKEGLTALVCVGEEKRMQNGSHLKYIESQILESLEFVTKKNISQVVIAYEPIWAIGKGKEAMSAHEVHQMVLFIRKTLASKFGMKDAESVPVLYGGSVDETNARELVHEGNTNGLLIGRASLKPSVLSEIISNM